MVHTTSKDSVHVAFFNTVAEADLAVRRLKAAGFSNSELAVICPDTFKGQLPFDIPRAERPGSHTKVAIAEGGAVGAALGGIALAATAVATGGVGLLAAIPILIGGGALAGGFSALILADGYGKDIGEYYEEAFRLNRIVIGVVAEGEDSEVRLGEAERILAVSGGISTSQMREQATAP